MTPVLPHVSEGLPALTAFSNIRLVALDIDGTLPSASHGRIGDVVGDLQASLASYRRGVTLTIATGRTFEAASAVMRQLRLKVHTPVVLYNGAVVATSSGEQILAQQVMHPETVAAVVACANDIGLRSLVFSCEFRLRYGYDDKPSALGERVTGVTGGEPGAKEFGGLPVSWQSELGSASDGVTAVLIETPTREASSTLRAHLTDAAVPVAVAASSARYVEISPPGATKASALEYLTTTLGIRREEVAAVGDNENDLAMLAWAGIGVAVRDATPAAVAVSDYVTRFGAGDGVVELLRLIRAAVRYRSIAS